jgi:CheY-like chemotaxis protein
MCRASAGREQEFVAAGFDGYVSKPVNVRELIGTVRQHCDARA